MRLFINEEWITEADLIEWATTQLSKKDSGWMHDLAELITNWYDDSDFISVTTSGSTGTPKVISHSKESMRKSALLTGERFGLRQGMISLHCLPSKFIAGKMMLIRALVLDMDQICVAPKLAVAVSINDQIDFAAMTPMQLSATLDAEPSLIDRVDQLILGGAPISSRLKERILGLSASCYATYGMTETITHIAIAPVKSAERPLIFETLTGVDIDTEEGNLVITAAHLDDPIVKTTDQVELKKGGQFIWLGRSDDVINRGGVKIHPTKIEEALSKLIKDRFIIVGVQNDVSGTSPVLLIESDEYDHEPIEYLRKAIEQLDKLERPENIYFVEKFEETQTGKIKRDPNLYIASAT